MTELLEFLKAQDKFRRTRLPALYSDFRTLKTLNPDGFAANVEAWKSGLAAAAREGCVPTNGTSSNLLLLMVDESLAHALETKEWGRPLALGAVLRDAMAKNEMMPLERYMSAKESIYQSSWSGSPWQVMSWGLKQLGLTDAYAGDDKLPVGTLVLMSNLEVATKEVLRRAARHTSRVDRIYSKNIFYREYRNVLSNNLQISHEDLEVLLTYLSRDKCLIDYNGRTIKFKYPSDPHPPGISHEDSGIASVKNLMFDIEMQAETLVTRIDKLTATARDAMSRKNRSAAIAALRTKKLVESHLAKQYEVLGQLEEVYSKIGEAANQVELVRIMEISTGVLKSLHKDIGGAERVDDVVDQLREQMIQVEEIGSVLTELDQTDKALVEVEIEDELEALESESQGKSETAKLSHEKKDQFGISERDVESNMTSTKRAPVEKQDSEERLEEGLKSLQQLSL